MNKRTHKIGGKSPLSQCDGILPRFSSYCLSLSLHPCSQILNGVTRLLCLQSGSYLRAHHFLAFASWVQFFEGIMLGVRSRSERGGWKSRLTAQHSENEDHGILSHHFMADFIFLGSKITADGDCNHEIKRRLLLGRKVMSNLLLLSLDSILKSRDITLPAKVRLIKAMVFPLVMSGCESWTIKKAEHRRIDAFEVWCWRRLLRVPWTARRSN